MTGELVVLLHSGGLSGAEWDAVAKKLGGYRTLAPDLLICTATRPATLAEEAARVLDLIEETTRGAGAVHVVGHSYGGAVALALAPRLGKRVRSLTLIEPTIPSVLRAAREHEALAELAALQDRCREDVDRGDVLAAAERFVMYWGGADVWRLIPKEFRAGVAQQMDRIGASWSMLVDAPLGIDDVRRLEVPTLVVRGDASPAPALRACALVEENLARGTSAVIAGAGHMSPITHPARVAEAIALHMNAEEQEPWSASS